MYYYGWIKKEQWILPRSISYQGWIILNSLSCYGWEGKYDSISKIHAMWI